MKANRKYYVSKNAGNGLELDIDISNTTDNILRQRRDLSGAVEAPPVKKRRRVVKKLVRVQPRNTTETDAGSSTTEASEVEVSTRRARRRLKVKKRKRLLKQANGEDHLNNLSTESEERVQQATKPRRKVVITRKRLLPKVGKSLDTSSETVAIETSSTTTMVLETTATHIHEDILTNQEDDKDVTQENVIENDSDEDEEEEITTEYTTESNDSDEYEDNELNDGNNLNEYDSEESRFEEYEDVTEENVIEDEDDNDENTESPTFQSIPEYEPFFPELTESLDAPILLLKTTVLSSVELLPKTIVQSRLRTYTFVVTRVHGNEQIVTSSTEVKPQTETSIVTESLTKYTTLTLLDFDATQTLTEPETTTIPTLDNSPPQLLNQDNLGRGFEEARYNLATRIMSNGVEVIVAGDKTTLPGEPDVRRVAPSSVQKPVTLKPSTLTDHMVMMLPQESGNLNSLASSLYPNQFVTKTCLTTFTYLTTYLEGSTTTVSSHEQVVSNIATEERNTGKILPTPAMGITLTQYPNLSVGVFHTTYTYLNTILDGEQPLVVSSKHTVTNTVTAPDDYLSLLQPSHTLSALRDTNTYYSTVALEKTLYEGDKSSVVSTNEVVTQVVITESVPPRATSVMTSYIALDVEDPSSVPMSSYSTTDVVKTYFVTYTYFNTIMENGKPVVNTNISTSSDVVTEKLYLHPKKTSVTTTSASVSKDEKKQKVDLLGENFHILATKTYFTTFTYFTTLLQENDPKTPTVISSRTRVVENLVTETISPSLLDKKYLNVLKSEIDVGSNSIIRVATLQDGQKLEITAIANELQEKIKPTKVLPIEKTKVPETTVSSSESVSQALSASAPNVITGSTIVFIDDDPFAQFAATPTLESKPNTATLKNNLGSLLSSEIVKSTKVSTGKPKRSTKTKVKSQSNTVRPTRTKPPGQQSETTVKTKTPNQNAAATKTKSQTDKKKQAVGTKVAKPVAAAPADLLGLGSINIQALTPVLNAMAGLISTNLKPNRRNDANITTTTTTPRPKLDSKKDGHVVPATDIQNRSPIYIPVGGLADDFEIAESQNIATFDWVDPPQNHPLHVKTIQEAPLVNGGIPISPGEIITANSDVIVGRPGRIGPRIPTIPLNQMNTENDVPIDMKPPPIPNKIWTKNHEYKHIPVANIRNDNNKPLVHAPNNVDYIGPPPPLKENLRGDKRKHIPLSPPRKEVQAFYDTDVSHNTRYGNNEIPLNQHAYPVVNQNNYGPTYASNEVNQVVSLPNLQHSIQQNYDSAVNAIYAQNHASLELGPSINEFNIKPPSVINEPIVLPEVIERSTGQPLLVNIQPSQVAFVNIPFNRTTALIYGGSTEPHKNGQYFDDPSPYPEPEFSGIEFNNGVPQVASVYHDQPSGQQQVNGVIKVGNQLINIEPASSDKNVQLNIRPSKPQSDAQIAFGNNHEISVNVPPISFGLVHQDNDFNAHIINHGEMDFRPPATPYEVTNEQLPESSPNYMQIPQNFNRPLNPPNGQGGYVNYPDHHQPINEIKPTFPQPSGGNKRPLYSQKLPPQHDIENKKPEDFYALSGIEVKKPYQGKPFPPKRVNQHSRPPRPGLEISEYMTPPPPVNKVTLPKRVYNRRPSKRPPLIPLSPNQAAGQMYNIPKPDTFNQHYTPSYIPNIDADIGDHREDDLENEEGEVIQESNSRPLLPGEVPFEILKAKTSTTERPTTKSNLTIRFPPDEQFKIPNYNNEIYHNRPVISQNARPFESSQQPRPGINFVRPQLPTRPQNPVVRPENQQTNEINNFDSVKQPSGFLNRHTTTERSNIQNNEIDRIKNGAGSFVVVGSQFEDPGNKHFIVSGNQFTNVVGQVNKNTNNDDQILDSYNVISTTTPRVTMKTPSTSTQKYPEFVENTVDNVFTFNTRNPIAIHKPKTTKGTTQRPIIIYIDDKVEDRDQFFNRKNDKNKNEERPSVTSLPIDTQASKVQDILRVNSTKPNTQTEKPFVPQKSPSQPTNQVNIINDISSTRPPPPRTTSPSVITSTQELNTGEISITYNNITTELSDMEIMKPPPLIPEVPVKKPYVEMQPPKIEIDTHGGDILRVPNLQTESGLVDRNSSPKPYVPEPLDTMVPPPPTTTDEEVLGMSPPPLVSTHKPIISNKPITTVKPVFSMEVDIPKEVPMFKPSTTTTTERYNRFTRPRRPYTRKPGPYRVSTAVPTTTEGSTIKRRPTYPVYNVINRGSTMRPTTIKVITPSPTVKSKPSLQVIIGHPNLDIDQNQGVTTTESYAEDDTKNQVELTGSEAPMREITTESTVLLDRDVTDLSLVESSVPTSNYEIHSSESSSKEDFVTQGIHHAGNEVKVVDEPIGSSVETTSKEVVPTYTERDRPVVPTRYITYTMTSTVTITKTTVITSLGGPPSTLTILVTKTETSTIVDTVTEFHTLLKPTSIIETVTTTVQQGSSLYPPDVYGSPYPSIQVKPSLVSSSLPESSTIVDDLSVEDLDEFIISDTDPPPSKEMEEEPVNNDSILVVMTDKNTKNIVKIPNSTYEAHDRDEIVTNNKVNNILLAGIFNPNVNKENVETKTDRCEPDCKAARNELCQRVEGIMRCVCRPGFARMFPDRPCLPTYTYNLQVTLDRIGKDQLHYFEDLGDSNSTEFVKFAQATREALDRMVMQSDLRDIFHGVQVHSFGPGPTTKGIVTRFYLQLSDNIDEVRLEDIFKKYLRNNNYSLGGTDIFASPQSIEELKAQDFDECSFSKFHDCSDNAQCFNLRGTYTCSCKEGYSDLSENMLYPGRICSAEQVGCERCNYHGTCYSREGDEVFCECFQWYAGDSCHVNLKVLLIALVTLGAILFILLLVCLILTCVRRKPRNAGVAAGMSFFPQRVGSSGNRSTLDRRAMIQDTSSEDSRSETNTLPYVQQKQKKPKGALKKTSKVSMQHPTDVENGTNTLSFSDQKDRSLTVMIPRAKYHPAPPTSPLMNYTTFDARKPSVPSVSEAKLLSYLDAGPSPNKSDAKRKFSSTPSETLIEEKPISRKTSGALVSAGFEVSATVVNNMGTLGTTCGTEADRSENATLIQKISADLLSSTTGTRSQFNTLRKSLVDDDLESSSNWLDIVPRVTTVSEARSYDETTIPPPMKSFRTDYDSKPSSQQPNDEANTMAERDLGSTFLLPHTHLYKPDRGSDISGFESL